MSTDIIVMNESQRIVLAARKEWQKEGAALARDIHTTAPWKVADWLTDERAWTGIKFNEAAAILGFSAGTCRNYHGVARAFPPSERHNDMTFGHHLVVAVDAISQEYRHKALDRAAKEGLSVSKFRKAIRESLKPKEPSRPDLITELRNWIKQEHPEMNWFYIQSSAYGIVERSHQKDAAPAFDLEMRSISYEEIKAVITDAAKRRVKA